jgi:hypothetical protein
MSIIIVFLACLRVHTFHGGAKVLVVMCSGLNDTLRVSIVVYHTFIAWLLC